MSKKKVVWLTGAAAAIGIIAAGVTIWTLRISPAQPDPIDVCEDGGSGSGFAQNECASRESIAAGIERNRKIDALARRFPVTAAPRFADLKSTFAAFSEAHAAGETYQHTSRRIAEVIEARDDEDDRFLENLTRLADNQWPGATQAAALAADAALNTSYQKALKACVEGDVTVSGVAAADVRTAQRAWLAYRDAYVTFAATAAPSVPEHAILTRLTDLRTAELDNLACD